MDPELVRDADAIQSSSSSTPPQSLPSNNAMVRQEPQRHSLQPEIIRRSTEQRPSNQQTRMRVTQFDFTNRNSQRQNVVYENYYENVNGPIHIGPTYNFTINNTVSGARSKAKKKTWEDVAKKCAESNRICENYQENKMIGLKIDQKNSHAWYEIGVSLGVNQRFLDSLQSEDIDQKAMRMLNFFYQSQYKKATIKRLAETLKHHEQHEAIMALSNYVTNK